MSRVLNRIKIYLAGNLENIHLTKLNYINWRDKFEMLVKPMGIICLSPLKKTFKNFKNDSLQDNIDLKAKLADGKYEEVSKEMKMIRQKDLRLVDIADVLITYLDPSVPSWGTPNEIYLAETLRKPSYLILDGGFKNCPLWLTAVYSRDRIMDDIESMVKKLERLNEGSEELDNRYWRLLTEEYLK